MTNKLRTVQDLPGPRGWPLVGNALLFSDRQLHLVLEGWACQYGPIYRFQIGPVPFVAIADPEVNAQILRQRPATYRRVSGIAATSQELGIHGVFSAEGDDWARQRRLAVEALNSKHLRHFFPTLARVIGRLQRRWTEAAHRGAAVDVQKELMRLTVDVTTNLAFGYDMNTLEKEGDVIQRHLAKIFPMIARRINAPFPYWHYVKLPADRAADRALVVIHQQIAVFIAQARQRLAAQPELAQQPSNFLEAMLAGEEAAQFSDAEIIGNVFTMLLAGEDTTANTMTWMLHYLCEYPAIFAQVQAEADAVLGADALIHQFEAVEKLTYIEAVAQEAMRLRPVAPLHFLEPNVAVEVAGVQIPKGIPLCLLTRPTLLNEENFVQPQEFRPERWLAGCPVQGAHNRSVQIPFGAGPRICPGRSLALLEIKATMAMIAHNFHLTRVGDPQQVREVFAFNVMPTGLALQFRQRRNGSP